MTNTTKRLGKSELYTRFAERFQLKRAQASAFFDELAALTERELQRCGEFEVPGVVKIVRQQRQARTGRNPATGAAIEIPAKTVVKARVSKRLKDEILGSVHAGDGDAPS